MVTAHTRWPTLRLLRARTLSRSNTQTRRFHAGTSVRFISLIHTRCERYCYQTVVINNPSNISSVSPFKLRVQPTHDASKVRASGPGLTTGLSASFPVEFTIDAKDAGEGQLSVQITVSTDTFNLVFLLWF